LVGERRIRFPKQAKDANTHPILAATGNPVPDGFSVFYYTSQLYLENGLPVTHHFDYQAPQLSLL
jgi:hypothetical protein